MTEWQAFEEGKTLGQTGTEGGVIIADEEHPGGARITLEQGCLRAPYAITCGVYGWMVHTRFLADDESAQHALAEMKPALTRIVDLLPGEDDMQDTQMDELSEAISQFTESFP